MLRTIAHWCWLLLLPLLVWIWHDSTLFSRSVVHVSPGWSLVGTQSASAATLSMAFPRQKKFTAGEWVFSCEPPSKAESPGLFPAPHFHYTDDHVTMASGVLAIPYWCLVTVWFAVFALMVRRAQQRHVVADRRLMEPVR